METWSALKALGNPPGIPVRRRYFWGSALAPPQAVHGAMSLDMARGSHWWPGPWTPVGLQEGHSWSGNLAAPSPRGMGRTPFRQGALQAKARLCAGPSTLARCGRSPSARVLGDETQSCTEAGRRPRSCQAAARGVSPSWEKPSSSLSPRTEHASWNPSPSCGLRSGPGWPCSALSRLRACCPCAVLS